MRGRQASASRDSWRIGSRRLLYQVTTTEPQLLVFWQVLAGDGFFRVQVPAATRSRSVALSDRYLWICP